MRPVIGVFVVWLMITLTLIVCFWDMSVDLRDLNRAFESVQDEDRAKEFRYLY